VIRFGLVGCGRIANRHSELWGGSHIEGPFFKSGDYRKDSQL
jgi:hypothetical protein